MHHQISDWIFHTKHKNQEGSPSGDKEATQSGCYAHYFTKSNKKDSEKYGRIAVLIKKNVYNSKLLGKKKVDVPVIKG